MPGFFVQQKTPVSNGGSGKLIAMLKKKPLAQ